MLHALRGYVGVNTTSFGNCIVYSNMTSSVGYANYTMIKLMIYFNSHIRIDEHITNIIP
jgi:hypothetical protein